MVRADMCVAVLFPNTFHCSTKILRGGDHLQMVMNFICVRPTTPSL